MVIVCKALKYTVKLSADIFLRILAAVLIKDIGLQFFLLVSLSGFGVGVMLTSKMSVVLFPPLQFLGRVCVWRISVNSSLTVWWTSQVKFSGPGHFFFERFWITYSIS